MSNEFDPAHVKLVSEAWKNAPCHHYPDSVCVPCTSVAILRALAAAGILRRDADATPAFFGDFCHKHFSWLCGRGQGQCQREAVS